MVTFIVTDCPSFESFSDTELSSFGNGSSSGFCGAPEILRIIKKLVGKFCFYGWLYQIEFGAIMSRPQKAIFYVVALGYIWIDDRHKGQQTGCERFIFRFGDFNEL